MCIHGIRNSPCYFHILYYGCSARYENNMVNSWCDIVGLHLSCLWLISGYKDSGDACFQTTKLVILDDEPGICDVHFAFYAHATVERDILPVNLYVSLILCSIR